MNRLIRESSGKAAAQSESQHVMELDISHVKEYQNQIKEEYFPGDDQSEVIVINSDCDEEDESYELNTSDSCDEEMNDSEQQQDGHNNDIDVNGEFVPDFTKANSLSFAQLCRRFEMVYKQKLKGSKKQSTQTLVGCLLPDKMYLYLNGSSFFPLLRLMLPDLDTSRPHTGMQERTISVAWADALGFIKQSRPYQKLIHFNDPTIAGPSAAGDLSKVVFEIMKDRFPDKPSNTNIGQINDMLDELVTIKNPFKTSHDWRSSISGSLPLPKKKNMAHLRRKWTEKVISKGLSPLEHKWLVRILLQKLELGIGSKTILQFWRKYAIDLYKGNNNLKAVCTKLCDPSFIRSLQAEEERFKEANRGTYMESSVTKAELGNTISPMLSGRVLFSTAMKELTEIHRKAVKSFPKDDPRRNYLPITQPCFIAEVKLDGERIVCHVKEGAVTMQTRNSVWYSDLYCPSLGPPIRKALANWNVNVILDGEVLSWDNGKKEYVPFGTNRTVAQARKIYMEHHGLLEQRDLNLHAGESDKNTMSASAQHVLSDPSIGGNCWLKYVLFDIIYVDGPGAKELLATALRCEAESVSTGSIVHFSCFDRKKILFQLVDPIENHVEHVPSLVIRPDGKTASARDYFSSLNPITIAGYPASMLDSVNLVHKGDDIIPNRTALNEKLRGGHSDAELSLRRTEALDQFYTDIVINRGLEGLILKDLNSEYIIDRRYQWFKHKPDNEDYSDISDIDLVILGGFYGTGMGPAAFLNSFLLGCVDPENPESFFSFCKINGGGTSRKMLESVLTETGYHRQTIEKKYSTGKWFKEKDHDQRKHFPDFISKRSFQFHGNPDKVVIASKIYPDLWIHPEDSIIVTVKAAEIVVSSSFSAGITLRFPRISRVRMKNSADDKPSRHVESVDALHQRYREMMQIREGSGDISFQSGSPYKCGADRPSRRFLTVEESLKKKSTRPKRSQINDMITWKMPTVDRKQSSALDGLNFVVLEGTYVVDEIDEEEARQMEWWDSIKDIKTREDVMRFILAHSGSLMLTAEKSTNIVLGGSPEDARVIKHYEGLEAAMKDKIAPRNRKGMTVDEMVQIGGVIKWSFIFSVVNKFIKEIKDQVKADGEIQKIFPGEASIQKTHSHLLKPTRHDYLRASAVLLGSNDNVYGISLNEKLTLASFKRGLAEVQRTEGRDKRARGGPASVILPWQQAAMRFPLEHRWVFGTPQTKFWTWKQGSNDPTKTVVVYPDLFGEDLGLREDESDDSVRWASVDNDIGSITACLPLIRGMGAKVSAHLHKGVTHVLCNLVDSISVQCRDFDVTKFCNPKVARRIRTRLSMLHPNGENPVLFVSPEWARAKYDE